MKKTLSLVHLALGTSLMLGMSGTLLAQSTAGTLHGTVLDPSGALVPKAQVIVSNASGFSRTMRSGSTGTFELWDLSPGNYSISVSATGFTPALDTVRVVNDRVTREDVNLRISVDQEIDVLAGDDGVSDNKR